MGVAYNPRLVTDGLVLALDAGNTKSYPGSGTSWTDISGQGGSATLTNGPTFSSSNLGSIVFDGINDYVASVSNITLANAFSISLWVKHTNSTPVQERYISLGSDRIVVQENENGDLNLYVTDGTSQNLWTWGYNGYGQLGINNTTSRSTPVTTILGGTNWKIISGGFAHTAAIKTDGTLWTWGRNVYGALGINSAGANRSTPVTTILGGTNWKSIAGVGYYTIAIKTDGTLWTWGFNFYGQLGVNDWTDRSTPTTTILGGTNWKSVAGGNVHTMAIKTDGTLWLWGSNSAGQLGINNTIDRSTPVTTILGGTNWKSVAGGSQHTIALKTDGTLWGWGYNSFGQLGINDTTERSTPVTTILGGNNWKSVSCREFYTVATKTDGTLWTWGRNAFGELGINNTTPRSTPVTTILGGTNWKSIVCGSGPIALKTDGTLWLWGGAGLGGSLGVNDVTTRSTPTTTILGGTNWKSVAGGNQHTIALKTDGTFINDVSTNAIISNSTYYNIVATSDGTTLTLYQNGTSLTTQTLNGSLSSTSLSYTVSSALEAFSGNLASVQVYNRALSSTEISQNFNALRGRFGV
jgi:alpha-tubulin suppressor-like RCC1 family protein